MPFQGTGVAIAWFANSTKTGISSVSMGIATGKPRPLRGNSTTSAWFANSTTSQAPSGKMGNASRRPWPPLKGTAFRSSWYHNPTVTAGPTASAGTTGPTWVLSGTGSVFNPGCWFGCHHDPPFTFPSPTARPVTNTGPANAVTAGVTLDPASRLPSVFVTPAPVFGALPIGDSGIVAQAGKDGAVTVDTQVVKPGGSGIFVPEFNTRVKVSVPPGGGGIHLGDEFHPFPRINTSSCAGDLCSWKGMDTRGAQCYCCGLDYHIQRCSELGWSADGAYAQSQVIF